MKNSSNKQNRSRQIKIFEEIALNDSVHRRKTSTKKNKPDRISFCNWADHIQHDKQADNVDYHNSKHILEDKSSGEAKRHKRKQQKKAKQKSHKEQEQRRKARCTRERKDKWKRKCTPLALVMSMKRAQRAHCTLMKPEQALISFFFGTV